jgi:membrane dipeptidase
MKIYWRLRKQRVSDFWPMAVKRLTGCLTALACLCAIAFVASAGAAAGQSWGKADANLIAEARAIHQRVLTFDAHADIEIPGKPSMYVGADGLSKVAVEKMHQGDLDAVAMAVAVGPLPRNKEGFAEARRIADEKLAAAVALTESPDQPIQLVKTSDALVAAVGDGQRAIVLSFQNALIFGDDVAVIDGFYDQGVRIFALTHMGHNEFADSSRPLFNAETGTREAPSEHGGLSPKGRAAVQRFNELGAVIDISQLSKTAALEVISVSRTPVIASHSNARALTNVSRNLSDAEIHRLAQGGGVIHVAPFAGYLFDSQNPEIDAGIRALRRKAGIDEDYLYPFELYWEIEDASIKTEFLTGVRGLLGPISLDTMLDHIDHIVALVGVEHVGIGTDFNHGSGIPGYIDASDSLNVTLGLLKRGYSESQIRKIWGGNFLRVWREVERRGLDSPAQ